MELSLELVSVMVVNVLAIGFSWGSLKTRVGALEKKLDNGLNAKVHSIDTKVSGIIATCQARGEQIRVLEDYASHAFTHKKT